MRSRQPELQRRVARVATTSAVVAAFVAALCAALVADQTISAAEERRLTAQAHAILAELAPLSRSEAAVEAASEADEVAALGLRIAVFEGADLLAGDANLRGTIGCSTAAGSRRCAVARQGRTCVVAAPELIAGRLATFGTAALTALVLAAVLGAAAGRRAAQWAVRPIVRLAAAARGSGSPVPDLGEDDGIREVDELRQALKETWARLADALAAARRFSADAAHELRTPLTTLSAELELMQESAGDDATLQRARASVAKLTKLTEQLLALSRAGERMPDGDAVLLRELFDTFAADDVTITGSADVTIRGDESLIVALAENAIANARQHGGGRVRVDVGEEGAEVTVDIRDDGQGVREQDRERLFEPFVRGSQLRGGHGIGLALIAHVARAHGGSARFLAADRGAHLRITFPAWQPRERV